MDEIDFYIELALQPTNRVLCKFMEKCRRYNYQSVDHLLRDLSPDLSSITQLDVNIPIEIGQRLLQEPTFLPYIEEFLTYVAYHPIDFDEYEARGITIAIVQTFLCKMIILDQCNTVELFIRNYVSLAYESLLREVFCCAVTNGRIALVQFLETYDIRLNVNLWGYLSLVSELNQIDTLKYIFAKSGITPPAMLTDKQVGDILRAWSKVKSKEAFDCFVDLGIPTERLINNYKWRHYRPPNRDDLSKNTLYEGTLATLNLDLLTYKPTTTNTLILPVPEELLAKLNPRRIVTQIDPPRLLQPY
jgi:hypothetical protein